MKGFMKIFFAAVLIATLAASAFPFQYDKGMVKETKTSGGVSFVYFNGIIYTIQTDGRYQLIFSEYDSEWVKLEVIPCYIVPQEYDPLLIQWSTFPPVVLEPDSDEGETYLLGTETGYAEK